MTRRPTRPPGRPPSRRAAAALRYAALGWPVLPLHTPTAGGGCSCSGGDCAKPGKHPRGRGGVGDATTRAAQITAWWTAWPNANVGVATGQLVVVDVDGEGGHAALAELERTHAPLPATLTATTGRGTHLYFTAGTHRIGNSAGRLGTGLDVRGHGGYIVAPPSHHADGRRYRWTSRRAPAPLPDWLAALLSPNERPLATPPAQPGLRGADRNRQARYFEAALRAELAHVTAAQPGTRNDTLNRAAFRLAQLAASQHNDPNALPRLLLQAAAAAGLPEAEALATIHSGLKAGQRHPRPGPSAR